MWLLILGCEGPDAGPPIPTEPVESAPPEEPLNVLLDDVGVDKVSSYAGDLEGYEPRNLPNTWTMDTVGAAGVRFTEAWSNPLCSPTRAGIYTGQHAYRHGVGTVVPQGPELQPDAVTFAEAIAHDYTVGLFGKWHVGVAGLETDEVPDPEWGAEAEGATREAPASIQHSLNPIQQGFAVFVGGITGTLCTAQVEGPCEGDYDHWLLHHATSEEPHTTRIWWEEGYATEVQVDETLRWIAEQPGPWAAMLALHAPHTPMHDTAGRGCARSPLFGPQPADIARYMGVLECADSHVERLLWELEALGELEHTMVVMAGDNGTEVFFRESVMAEDTTIKGTAYDSSVHVPLVIAHGASWASVARGGEPVETPQVALPGRTVDQMVHTTDLFATLLQWTGGDRSTGTDSLSLAPVLEGPSVEMPRELLYTERIIPSEEFGLVGMAAIRDTEGHKLVADVHPTQGALCLELQLFEPGPVDLVDRYGDEELAEAQATLEAELAARIEDGAAWLAAPRCP